ncbi:MAG: SRPBCC family protein [bacterium]
MGQKQFALGLTLEINCPAVRAFETAGDAASQPAWIESLVEVRPAGGELPTAGSTFVQVHRERGVEQLLEGEVIEWRPHELMVVRLSHADLIIESRTEFEDLGQCCRLILGTDVRLASLKARLAAPFLRQLLEARMCSDFARLKAMLEN